MADAADLLRLLEPAVRPGNLPGPVRPTSGGSPIESRSFEALLAEAQALAAGGEPAAGDRAVAAERSPLAWLGQFDRVENPTLRHLMASQPHESAASD